jgi:hypothetical protein
MTSQYVIAQGSDEMAHQFVHHQGIEIIVECMNKYTENIFLQRIYFLKHVDVDA